MTTFDRMLRLREHIDKLVRECDSFLELGNFSLAEAKLSIISIELKYYNDICDIYGLPSLAIFFGEQ